MNKIAPKDKIEDIKWTIDSGFIYHKKCFSKLGNEFFELYSKYKNPREEYPHKVENEHLFVNLALTYCRNNNIPTLSEVLQNPNDGDLFCSLETFEGSSDVYKSIRIRNKVVLPFEYKKTVWNEFSSDYFTCDTGKSEQSTRCRIAIIGVIYKVLENEIILHPLIMGGATFNTPNQNPKLNAIDLLFKGSDWFEILPEDIDNFSKIKDITVTPNEWQNYMKDKSEDDIKNKLCEILGDTPKKDWGGELNDHFSTTIEIAGKRIKTAFLLKGPAGGNKFREMTPLFLGKNGDQISRLSKTPADLIVVQHCHEIGEAVRETLQAFAVAPHIQKRYCLLDGRDTYRILKAYNKL